MNTTHSNEENEELKSKILDAAEARFRDYGYGKTTMAEIAKDVDMSAANLYRYFHNKEDIAVECSERCMLKTTDEVKQAVRNSGSSASKRLRTLVLASLKSNLEEFEKSPKISELIDLVSKKHKALVKDKVQAQCAIIAEILAYGNETGEFDVKDVIKMSQTVHASLVLFHFPLFDGFFSHEEFESMANDVVDLIINGLRKI